MDRKTSSNGKQLLTVKEVATWLNISASLVYQLVDAGKLPVHRIGNGRGAIRFSIEDVEHYIAGCRTQEGPPSAPLPHRRLKHLKL